MSNGNLSTIELVKLHVRIHLSNQMNSSEEKRMWELTTHYTITLGSWTESLCRSYRYSRYIFSKIHRNLS